MLLGASYIYAGQRESKFPVPDHISTQFAGNIGFISLGTGYKFFKQRWQTDLLIGYTPHKVAKTEILTVAWKNTMRLYKLPVFKNDLSFHFAFSVNLETGANSELNPSKYYPKDYYQTNSLHTGVFLGSRYNIPLERSKLIESVDIGLEVCSLLNYMHYNIVSKNERYNDIYSLSFHTNINF